VSPFPILASVLIRFLTLSYIYVKNSPKGYTFQKKSLFCKMLWKKLLKHLTMANRKVITEKQIYLYLTVITLFNYPNQINS